MNGYKVATFIATSALLVSLGGHWAGASDEVETPASESGLGAERGRVGAERSQGLESSRACTSVAAGERESAPWLPAELEETCRRMGWAATLAPLAPGDVLGPGESTPEDANVAREIVNDVAREHLRDHWNQKRDEILESLREVGTDAWVAEEVDKKASARAERFDLDSAATDGIREGYAAMWREHAEELSSSIESEDWEGVMAQASVIWAEEDAIHEAHLAPEQYEAFVGEEERTRVTILAIFATLADVPWDDEMLAF